jgi:nitronate monooxygenase
MAIGAEHARNRRDCQGGAASQRSLKAMARISTNYFAWADALADLEPEAMMSTHAFSHRLGRSGATDYVRAAASPEAPRPAPYLVQRGLTAVMREAAQRANDVHRMQAWPGQAAALARPEPAAKVVARLWQRAQMLLPMA